MAAASTRQQSPSSVGLVQLPVRDYPLLMAALALAVLSLVMIASVDTNLGRASGGRGMHRYRLRDGNLTERPEEGLPIRLGEEDVPPVDPAHHHMQGVAGNNDSGMSGHWGAATRIGKVKPV